MSFKQLIALAILGLGMGERLLASKPRQRPRSRCRTPGASRGAPSTATINRQQCEETVDYHGFCVTNPDYRAPNDNTRRRALPQ